MLDCESCFPKSTSLESLKITVRLNLVSVLVIDMLIPPDYLQLLVPIFSDLRLMLTTDDIIRWLAANSKWVKFRTNCFNRWFYGILHRSRRGIGELNKLELILSPIPYIRSPTLSLSTRVEHVLVKILNQHYQPFLSHLIQLNRNQHRRLPICYLRILIIVCTLYFGSLIIKILHIIPKISFLQYCFSSLYIPFNSNS